MSKESITIRLQPELIDRLEREAEEAGVSRSAYIRQILRERDESDELRTEIEILRQRLESREERVSELEQQLARRSNIEEKVDTSNAPFFVQWYKWFRERD